MPKVESLIKQVFQIDGTDRFNELALKIFHHQQENNTLYQQFIRQLAGLNYPKAHFTQIPFLPIEFFKTFDVQNGLFDPVKVFTSSGTTGMTTSKHLIRDLRVYEQSFIQSFTLFFGDPKEYTLLALLPAYLERNDSSLVYMADTLIRLSRNSESGFYLDEYEKLSALLNELKRKQKKTMLLGVTFALLDLAEKFPVSFPELLIMETGGMKGRRKEMVREELHAILFDAFKVKQICSEYGMTELLSQAYSLGEGKYRCPPWMKVLIRDVNDPLTLLPPGKTGGINIIDLANIDSCSFIATQDLGKVNPDGSFEVLGRFDNSDIRGCNLMVV
jgi:phenylacetate-coenzyme A ligase PaaK-like adenylate-forming protein